MSEGLTQERIGQVTLSVGRGQYHYATPGESAEVALLQGGAFVLPSGVGLDPALDALWGGDSVAGYVPEEQVREIRLALRAREEPAAQVAEIDRLESEVAGLVDQIADLYRDNEQRLDRKDALLTAVENLLDDASHLVPLEHFRALRDAAKAAKKGA